ncbi:tRNA-dihydrouridine synthase [Halodesulfurarchaeum sp.]|uniref:tRNA-dihydrouridine synthase n=1 Tax=Halodesulfurarchaeum sp. TaxID=1980530 RepID=UPI002FC306FA
MFEPRVAVASLSGKSDADWAKQASPWAGAAFLGGLALDKQTRTAARQMVTGRDRSEFLPEDPFGFMESELRALDETDITPGFNVRSVDQSSLKRAAKLCADYGAYIEINAHCRQPEMTRIGAGQALLTEPERLANTIRTAAQTDATVSLKVRTEILGVDLQQVSQTAVEAGADILHIDAMDSESVIKDVKDRTTAFIIANNGVRDQATAIEYLEYGADAVSVARPSTNTEVLRRVKHGVKNWFETQ